MPKPRIAAFVCQSCGYQSPKWQGLCPNCNAWNTFVETTLQPEVEKKKRLGFSNVSPAPTFSYTSIQRKKVSFDRLSTGFGEVDRVLGGGIVTGSVSLIGGEPGIGKSTLLTHIMLNILMKEDKNTRIFYICGEESPEQIALRIGRIVGKTGSREDWKQRITFVLSTDVDACIALVEKERPALVIVDSIQSMQTHDLTGTAGSIGQLNECTQRLTRMAKTSRTSVFLVGHVTKEGTIAGPKILEHIVDTVLELTGERTGCFRILRSVKNRFGATDEVGVFQVVEYGLEEVTNPSKMFLEESQRGAPGSAVISVLEGTRPVLVEIQALVVKSQLVVPRRVARGVALPRIQLLAAVLEKHCSLPLGTMDIFVNVAGGFTIQEPAADLGVAIAIASSLKNAPPPSEAVYVGEIGLLGEVRRVTMLEKRAREAKRLGFSKIISSEVTKNIRMLVQDL